MSDESLIARLYLAYRRCGRDPQELIVIGGEAGRQWYVQLSDSEDDANGAETTALRTQDIDFQVASKARRSLHDWVNTLADELNANVYIPAMDEHTPELAKLVPEGAHADGDAIEIDFMESPYGLEANEIEEHVETFTVATDVGTKIDYPIIHPVHALIALCENHRGLRPRRLVRDRIQALLPIARRYLIAEAPYAEAILDEHAEVSEAVRDRVRWGIRELLEASAKPAYARFSTITASISCRPCRTRPTRPLYLDIGSNRVAQHRQVLRGVGRERGRTGIRCWPSCRSSVCVCCHCRRGRARYGRSCCCGPVAWARSASLSGSEGSRAMARRRGRDSGWRSWR